MFIGIGIGMTQPRSIAAPAPAGDDLDAMLAALEASGKLVCAWFLPSADPDQYLTLNGAAVEGWAAAYGTQKVDLAELTNPPAWDATLFGNKGGVVFDGTNDSLANGALGDQGAILNWPDSTASCWLLAACRNDSAGATSGFKYVFGYGSSTNIRTIRRTSSSSVNRAGMTQPALAGATTDFSGAHTIGSHHHVGDVSRVYVDGVEEAANGGSSTSNVNLAHATMGKFPGTSNFYFHGAIACAAILASTATLQDFTDLEALMRGRLS